MKRIPGALVATLLVAAFGMGCAGPAPPRPPAPTVGSFLSSLEGDPCARRYLLDLLVPSAAPGEAFTPVRTQRLAEGAFRRSRVEPDFEEVRRTALSAYTSVYPELETPLDRGTYPEDLPEPVEFGLTRASAYDTMPFLPVTVDGTTVLDTLRLGAPNGRWTLLVPFKPGPPAPTPLLSPYWILLREERAGHRHRLDLLFSRAFFPIRNQREERSQLALFSWRGGEALVVPYVRTVDATPEDRFYLDLLQFDLGDSSATYFEGPEIVSPWDTRRPDLRRYSDCLVGG